MREWKEIVIVVEVDPDRLADFPAVLEGTLDAWSALLGIGDSARWAVYSSACQPYLFEL
jgi:hypothetical protein